MKCEDAQTLFSSYLDDELLGATRLNIDKHLQECPVCRAELDETRFVRRGLILLRHPAPPPELAAEICRALTIERAARELHSSGTPALKLFAWLKPHLMPYAVGAFASMLLFLIVAGALRPHLRVLRDLAIQSREAPDAIRDNTGLDINQPVTIEGYAASRNAFSAESPSLNPKGALASLVWTSTRGSLGDDDMLVVADVFRDGKASLAEVVQPPRNRRMIGELQDALRKTPAFVPASFDRRPETMRVVFFLQKVDVPERSF